MNVRFKFFLKKNIFIFIVVSCCVFSFLLIEFYVAKFRVAPLYASTENIKCSKASLLAKEHSGGRFSSRDRKSFLLESGEIVKASLYIKLPVIDGNQMNSDYYRALLDKDFGGYYLCYLLIEDQVLSDNNQVVYLSKYKGQNGLDKEYIVKLEGKLNDFNRESNENGWWVYMEIYAIFTGILVGILGLIFQKSLNREVMKFNKDS